MTTPIERFKAAYNKMAEGVANKVFATQPGTDTHTKRNRIGLNVALSDHGALLGLLVAKGVITQAEYDEARADAMEASAADYAA